MTITMRTMKSRSEPRERKSINHVLCRGLLLRMLRHGPCSESNVRAVARIRGIADGLSGAMQSLGVIIADQKMMLPVNVVGVFPASVRSRVARGVRQKTG